MANWCDNQVEVLGDPTVLKNIKDYFKQTLECPKQAETHWLAPFVLDIELMGNKVCYCSRWIPNNHALVLLADEFKVNFVNRYDEMATGIFGEAKYEKGIFSDVRLDPNDFQSYYFDDQTKLYVHDGKNYSFEWPIFEKLLEQKKGSGLHLKSTTEITKYELVNIYGELLPGDLNVKLAEHKNFELARESFNELDNLTVNEIENYISDKPHARENYKSERAFLAFSFLRSLLTEKITKQNHENGFTR